MLIHELRSPAEAVDAAEVALSAFGPNAVPMSWRECYERIVEEFGHEVFLVAEEDGRLVSSLLCLPSVVWMEDREVTLGAVGSVATRPEYQRRGYAGALMCAVVRRMQESGIVLSALAPFSFRYYRKFGWELVGEHRTYRFASDRIGSLPEPEGVAPMTPEDLSGIAAAADAHGRRLALCTHRSDDWWRGLLWFEGAPPFAQGERATTRMIVCREGDEVVGYAIYRPPAGEEQRANVRELVTLTPNARLHLLSALAQEGAAEIQFDAPRNDFFRTQVPEPRPIQTSLGAGFAFRVIDPGAALESLSLPEDLRGTCAFTIQDPARPDAPLRVQADIAEGIVSAHSKSSSAASHLSTDIATFSQMYAGYLRPADAVWLGRLDGDSASVAFAERLFPRWVAFRSSLEPG